MDMRESMTGLMYTEILRFSCHYQDLCPLRFYVCDVINRWVEYTYVYNTTSGKIHQSSAEKLQSYNPSMNGCLNIGA